MDQESPTAGSSPCVCPSGVISVYVMILSQPGLVFPPSPQPVFHQSSRFRFESYRELTGKLVLGAEGELSGGHTVSLSESEFHIAQEKERQERKGRN